MQNPVKAIQKARRNIKGKRFALFLMFSMLALNLYYPLIAKESFITFFLVYCLLDTFQDPTQSLIELIESKDNPHEKIDS